MAKMQVLGVGGTFLRAQDPEALRAWYAKAFDLAGRDCLLLPSAEGIQAVWQSFGPEDPYLGRLEQAAMLNYRVASLEGAIAHLQGLGVQVEGPADEGPLGRFAWGTDPEGHRFELWEAGEAPPRSPVPPLTWRLELNCPLAQLWAAWSTDEGRCSFWARRSEPTPEGFRLHFPAEGMRVPCHVLQAEAPHLLVFTYVQHSLVTLKLEALSPERCRLELSEEGFEGPEHRAEHQAGWVSVLLNLKAWLEHGLDLRNPEGGPGWAQGHCNGA